MVSDHGCIAVRLLIALPICFRTTTLQRDTHIGQLNIQFTWYQNNETVSDRTSNATAISLRPRGLGHRTRTQCVLYRQQQRQVMCVRPCHHLTQPDDVCGNMHHTASATIERATPQFRIPSAPYHTGQIQPADLNIRLETYHTGQIMMVDHMHRQASHCIDNDLLAALVAPDQTSGGQIYMSFTQYRNATCMDAHRSRQRLQQTQPHRCNLRQTELTPTSACRARARVRGDNALERNIAVGTCLITTSYGNRARPRR